MESKRQNMELTYTDSVNKNKKKSWQSLLLKKVMLIVLWDMKGPITVNFLVKGATLFRDSYCQLL